MAINWFSTTDHHIVESTNVNRVKKSSLNIAPVTQGSRVIKQNLMLQAIERLESQESKKWATSSSFDDDK